VQPEVPGSADFFQTAFRLAAQAWLVDSGRVAVAAQAAVGSLGALVFRASVAWVAFPVVVAMQGWSARTTRTRVCATRVRSMRASSLQLMAAGSRIEVRPGKLDRNSKARLVKARLRSKPARVVLAHPSIPTRARSRLPAPKPQAQAQAQATQARRKTRRDCIGRRSAADVITPAARVITRAAWSAGRNELESYPNRFRVAASIAPRSCRDRR
jgi:hypothetical protein